MPSQLSGPLAVGLAYIAGGPEAALRRARQDAPTNWSPQQQRWLDRGVDLATGGTRALAAGELNRRSLNGARGAATSGDSPGPARYGLHVQPPGVAAGAEDGSLVGASGAAPQSVPQPSVAQSALTAFIAQRRPPVASPVTQDPTLLEAFEQLRSVQAQSAAKKQAVLRAITGL